MSVEIRLLTGESATVENREWQCESPLWLGILKSMTAITVLPLSNPQPDTTLAKLACEYYQAKLVKADEPFKVESPPVYGQ